MSSSSKTISFSSSSYSEYPSAQQVNVTNLTETEDNLLLFTLENVDVSIANAIRRTILSNIETLVFRTTPNDCRIETNNTKLNNEILKHRLGCIPIHHLHTVNPRELKDMMLEVNVKNESAEYRMVTTKDFRIKRKSTGEYMNEDTRDLVFPPFRFPKHSQKNLYYIDFVKLRPKIENIPGEHIHLTCDFSSGKASEDGMYNVVSTCSYGFTKDNDKVEAAYRQKESELKGQGLQEAEIRFALKDWLLLDSFRLTKPNCFDFVVETIGVYSNQEIVIRALDYLVDLFTRIQQVCHVEAKTLSGLYSLTYPSPSPSPSLAPSSLENSHPDGTPHTTAAGAATATTEIDSEYVIYINEDEYTLGKVIEKLLYHFYFVGSGEMSFCGFRKAHPHDTYATIQVSYLEPKDKNEVYHHLQNVADQAITIINKIRIPFLGESAPRRSRVKMEVEEDGDEDEEPADPTRGKK